MNTSTYYKEKSITATKAGKAVLLPIKYQGQKSLTTSDFCNWRDSRIPAPKKKKNFTKNSLKSLANKEKDNSI